MAKKTKTEKKHPNESSKSNPVEADSFEIQIDFDESWIQKASNSTFSESHDRKSYQEDDANPVQREKGSPEAEGQILDSSSEVDEEFRSEKSTTSGVIMSEGSSSALSEGLATEEYNDKETAADSIPVADTPQLVHNSYDEVFAGELDEIKEKEIIPEVQLETSSTKIFENSFGFQEKLNLDGQIEAILFASPKPMKAYEVWELLQDEGEEQNAKIKEVERVIQSLVRTYEERAGGFRLINLRGQGYQFQTAPAAATLMEKMFSTKPRPLSRAALETLAIIAYRQPVTRADIENVRGVDAGSIIKNLLERDLIKCVGRKDDSGRPMLFGTSDEFLNVFRLSALSDLPPLVAFQPSPETIHQALSKLDEDSQEVDIETFIGDENSDDLDITLDLVEQEDKMFWHDNAPTDKEAGQEEAIQVDKDAPESNSSAPEEVTTEN